MIQLWSNLEKYSCDICGRLGEKPVATVEHQDGSKVDICKRCKEDALRYPKFQEGIKSGDIKLILR